MVDKDKGTPGNTMRPDAGQPSTPQPDAGQPAELYDLYIENESEIDVYEVYVSPPSASSWGSDRLGNDVLAPGDSKTITGLECGDYDFKIVDENDDECFSVDTQTICEDDGADFYINDETFPDCL